MQQLPIIVDPEMLQRYLLAIQEKAEHEANQKRPPRMRKVVEAAAETGLSQNCVRQLCLTGKVAHVNAGRRLFVNLDDLINYLSTNREGEAG